MEKKLEISSKEKEEAASKLVDINIQLEDLKENLEKEKTTNKDHSSKV